MREYTIHMGQGRVQSGTTAGSELSSVDLFHLSNSMKGAAFVTNS
jgi:hypothetical protein